MGYRFIGFLTADSEAAAAAAARWAFCEMKQVDEQFDGFIVRCPNEDDLHPTDGDEAWERIIEQGELVRTGLLDLSLQFPQVDFVYVEVTCFGGTCMHEGAHFLHGREVTTFASGEDEVDLAEILRPLGIRLDAEQYFKPFTRGYFEKDKLQRWTRPAAPVATAAPPSESGARQRRWWQFW